MFCVKRSEIRATLSSESILKSRFISDLLQAFLSVIQAESSGVCFQPQIPEEFFSQTPTER